MYDVIIVGGGPAAVAAGVYAARKKLKTLVITDSFGGQSVVSDGIENWIGAKSISGFDLAKNLEEHLRAQPSVEIRTPERVVAVREIPCADGKRPCDWAVETDKGNVFETKTVIVTSGARRRRLGVPGEDKFEGKGVAFCATCDAPVFSGKRVAVVGGGNAGLEAVVDLFPYASEIYLVHRGEQLKGDAVTQEEIKKNPKVRIILNAETQEVIGDKFMTALRYKDKTSGEIKDLAVEGVFVEVGSLPNTDFVKGVVDLNEFEEIIIDHKTSAASKPGIYAAGDATDEIYKQNNISAGDGVKAALSAYSYIMGLKKRSAAAEKPSNNG